MERFKSLYLLVAVFTVVLVLSFSAAAQERYTVNLKSLTFTPPGRFSPDSVTAIRTDLDRIMGDPLRSRIGKVHVLIQLGSEPSRYHKEDLKRYGVELLEYIPPNTWTAALSGDIPVAMDRLEALQLRYIGRLSPDIKQSQPVLTRNFEEYVLMPDDRAILLVQFHKTVSLEVGRELVTGLGAEITDEIRTINSLVIAIPKDNINNLAAEDGVLWIEQAPPRMDATNDNARVALNVNAIQAPPYNLDGNGVTVMVFDDGLVDDNHPDFGGRVIHGETTRDVEDHPTHVAGTLGGDGGESVNDGGTANQWRGMAPGVDIVSYGVNWTGSSANVLYSNTGDLEEDFEQALNDHGADIATASVGTNVSARGLDCDWEGDYNATSQLIDGIVRGELGKPIITTWAAGNERGVARCGTQYNSINPPAAAKNPIHVGAINSDTHSMTNFSGWGPTDDGRLKPVIVAPGCQSGMDNAITSTIPNLYIDRRGRDCAPGVASIPPNIPTRPNTEDDDYCYPYDVMCGTSMATPGVAGVAAMMVQQYRTTYNTSENPLPSTIKAILIHTAGDIGNTGPDFRFGYGLVNARRAIDLIRSGLYQIIESQINEDDETDVYNVTVPNGANEFTVSLTWDDEPGAILATTELVNDLDLSLEAPDGITIHRPWILDPTAGNEDIDATTGVDDLNNMEQVEVTDDDLVAGVWKIRIVGTDVQEPIQKYSLVSDFPLQSGNHISVVQAIDRSGSMSYKDDPSYPNYMESAKIAAQNFIGLMNLGDEIGVLSFDDDDCDYTGDMAEPRFNLEEMTNVLVRNNAVNSISGLDYRGCTPIGACMELAQDGPNFLDAANVDNPHAIILLSDGYENRDPRVSTVLPNIPEKTDIYTIALGNNSDEDLLKEIADETGGKYYHAPTILGLLSIYYQIQGDLQLGSMASLETGTKGGGNDTQKVYIDQGTAQATFAVGWLQSEGDLVLSLEDPDGKRYSETTPGTEFGNGLTYEFIKIDNPVPGEWTARITRGDRGTFNINYTFAAFVADVDRTWSYVPTFEVVGNCLLTKVQLFDDRTHQPVTGAKVQAKIVFPEKYKYTLHYELVKPSQKKWKAKRFYKSRLMATAGGTAVKQTGEIPTWVTTLNKYNLQSIKNTGQSIYKYDTIVVRLFDDGSHSDEVANDGIYTNCIDTTQIAGSYDIYFTISGGTVADRFERRIISSAFMEPGAVDPARAVVRMDPSVLDLKEGSEAIITIVPMDKYGNVWGPGNASRIAVSTSAGQLRGLVEDNGDGFYFQKIISTGVKDTGQVTVNIDDTELASKPTVIIGPPPPTFKRFGVSLHSGAAIPIGEMADYYDPGFNVMLDFGYWLNPNLALMAFLGYNDFKAKSAGTDDNYIINLSVNARYYQPYRLLPMPPWSYYIGGGLGYYLVDIGDNEPGFNVGAGLNYEINPTITLEVGADYHQTFDNDIKFIHTHGGVIVRFDFK